MLAAALTVAQAPPAVKAPDTAAGKALAGFIESFNAGGDTRKTWVETQTTIEKEATANILQMDAQVLAEHGPVTIARIAASTDTTIAAVIRHAKTGVHGYVTIEVDKTAPHKVTNVNLRGATPEEIKGGLM